MRMLWFHNELLLDRVLWEGGLKASRAVSELIVYILHVGSGELVRFQNNWKCFWVTIVYYENGCDHIGNDQSICSLWNYTWSLCIRCFLSCNDDMWSFYGMEKQGGGKPCFASAPLLCAASFVLLHRNFSCWENMAINYVGLT